MPTEISDSFDNVLKYTHIFLKFSNFSLVPFGGLIWISFYVLAAQTSAGQAGPKFKTVRHERKRIIRGILRRSDNFRHYIIIILFYHMIFKPLKINPNLILNRTHPKIYKHGRLVKDKIFCNWFFFAIKSHTVLKCNRNV